MLNQCSLEHGGRPLAVTQIHRARRDADLAHDADVRLAAADGTCAKRRSFWRGAPRLRIQRRLHRIRRVVPRRESRHGCQGADPSGCRGRGRQHDPLRCKLHRLVVDLEHHDRGLASGRGLRCRRTFARADLAAGHTDHGILPPRIGHGDRPFIHRLA